LVSRLVSVLHKVPLRNWIESGFQDRGRFKGHLLGIPGTESVSAPALAFVLRGSSNDLEDSLCGCGFTSRFQMAGQHIPKRSDGLLCLPEKQPALLQFDNQGVPRQSPAFRRCRFSGRRTAIKTAIEFGGMKAGTRGGEKSVMGNAAQKESRTTPMETPSRVLFPIVNPFILPATSR
jgi:hypothetical protein